MTVVDPAGAGVEGGCPGCAEGQAEAGDSDVVALKDAHEVEVPQVVCLPGLVEELFDAVRCVRGGCSLEDLRFPLKTLFCFLPSRAVRGSGIRDAR